MTGIAAVSLGRQAQLSDISVLGKHIATGYLTDVSPSALRKAAQGVAVQARAALGDLYTTPRESDGLSVEMVRTVWSFTYRCPNCAYELVYYEYLVLNGMSGPTKCPKCSGPFARRSWPRADDVPVEVVVRDRHGRLTEQEVGEVDFEAILRAAKDPRQAQVPSRTIDPSREMYSRSGLGKAGLTETAGFFSPRNAIALLELWRAISSLEDQGLRKKLSFSFTAILPRASRRYQWSAQRPLNAQNQTYYVAPIYYEWNVFELFDRKVEAAIRADEEVTASTLFGKSREKRVEYTLSSADHLLHLDSESVDYVFTDPPFGSNIFYSDMNLFHEAWLGQITDHAHEAVMHTTGSKKNGAAERYETLLRGAFAEAFRVLKPGRYMSVVFGNSDGRIWGLVQRALRHAGFDAAPAHVAILDKGQRSVKGLNSGSEGVVTVDLIMTVQKPTEAEAAGLAVVPPQADTAELIRTAIETLPRLSGSNPSHVYAAILRDAIRRREAIDHLHLSDVLIGLRSAGYDIDLKTGLLIGPAPAEALSAAE
ncbi:MAG TPA: hypothetical protein VGG11_18915 [Xanthobacteraceae bacterium]